MEVVAACADVDYHDASLLQAIEHLTTKCRADTTPLGGGVHGDHVHAASVSLGDVPSDVAQEPPSLLGEGYEPVVVWIVEGGYFPLVVAFPVAVVVREDSG